MTEEISQHAKYFSEVLGKELVNDIEKFMLNVFSQKEICVGIRKGYELTKRRISFNEIVFYKDIASVVDNKYKPSSLNLNDGDYYFGAEEIARFNSRKTFFGIIGEKWFENEMGDEFIEAVIFGAHNVNSIDCMLGSVRKNTRYKASTYVAPGALVCLTKAAFNNTVYLDTTTFLEKVFVDSHPEPPWHIGDYLNTYYWNGNNYTTESIYSSKDNNDGYEDDEY